jgi:hypothetical protein
MFACCSGADILKCDDPAFHKIKQFTLNDNSAADNKTDSEMKL